MGEREDVESVYSVMEVGVEVLQGLCSSSLYAVLELKARVNRQNANARSQRTTRQTRTDKD